MIKISLIGILILLMYSCQEKVLKTDSEKMQLGHYVEFVFEQTYEIFPINDTLRKFTETIEYSESDYWKFNQAGFIIEHGYLLTCEDSSYRIKKYSNELPYNLEQMIRYFKDIDTMYFFENTISKGDTIFKYMYFADSTLYKSEIKVIDKIGRETDYILQFPPRPKVHFTYYTNGLVKEKIFSEPMILLDRIKFEYNEQNLIAEEIYYDNDKVSLKIKYEYSYDKNKNWITRTEYFDKVPVQIKVRNIKYHDK